MTETQDAAPLFEDFPERKAAIIDSRIREKLGPFGELSGILDEHGNLDPDKIRANILPPVRHYDEL